MARGCGCISEVNETLDIYKITDSDVSPDELGLNVIKVPPIDGRSLSASHYFDLIVGAYNEMGKLLSPSEVGCALSHISIYESIQRANRPALIFESDITLTAAQIQAVKDLIETEPELDFLHLGWHPEVANGLYFRVKELPNTSMTLADPLNAFYGAFAYFVSPRAASELIEFHRNHLHRADAWARFFDGSAIPPKFLGVFSHPIERNTLDSERNSVSGAVYLVTPKSILRYLRSLIKQKLMLLDWRYKPSKPE